MAATLVGVLFIIGTVAGILFRVTTQGGHIDGPDYLADAEALGRRLPTGALLTLAMGLSLAFIPVGGPGQCRHIGGRHRWHHLGRGLGGPVGDRAGRGARPDRRQRLGLGPGGQPGAWDDRGSSGQTQPVVDELLDAPSFAIQTAGSGTTLHVYDKLDAACVPHPFVLSLLPTWGDTENHPWVWGHQLSYTTEARPSGGLIETAFAGQRRSTSAP
jgi:hypothetical protein